MKAEIIVGQVEIKITMQQHELESLIRLLRSAAEGYPEGYGPDIDQKKMCSKLAAALEPGR